MIIPVILAGGSGTRLWPLSRELYPKQLLPFVDDKTMLQNTVLRIMHFKGVQDPIIICNEKHRFMVAEQLRKIHIKPFAIFLEPVGRNTAPAVAIAALKALSSKKDSVLLILPADHNIDNIAKFHEAVRIGEQFARKNNLITFGVIPDAPETGYGYIKKGKKIIAASGDVSLKKPEAVTIDEFVEKPDLETAEKYITSGNYCWNSGMFMFRASRIMEELKQYVPDIVDACEKSFYLGKEDLDFFRLDPASFESSPGDSIDCAVMERTDQGVMVPFQAGWNDLGSWEALWSVGEKDESGNVIHGDVIVHDVKESLLHASNRLIAAVGLENHIIVETADAVLILPMDRAQDIKILVNTLKTGQREEARSHRKVYRPWGFYECIGGSNHFQVRHLVVNPGKLLSLQKHHHRSEHWIVIQGTALVTRGEEQFILKKDESTYIPNEVTHRLENQEKIHLEIIEVQSGSFLDEKDIVRL